MNTTGHAGHGAGGPGRAAIRGGNRFRALWLLGWGCLLTPARAGMPERFPDVELRPNSQPLYAAFGIDAWAEDRVAYLKFDGNVEQGYNRVYVWIPGDREFGTPVARRANPDQVFRPLDFTSHSAGAGTPGAEQALMQWRLRYGQRTHGSYFDYARGVRVERETRVRPILHFECDFGIAPRTATTRHVARMPLALTIPGEFRIVEDWSRLNRVDRPWQNLEFYMHRVAQRERRRAVVRFQGRMQHRSHPGHVWRDVAIHALPPGANCALTIRPYMQAPVFSESIPAEVAFGAGKVVDLPFAWYEYDWRFECPGIRVRPREDHRVTLIPHPLGPFDFE